MWALYPIVYFAYLLWLVRRDFEGGVSYHFIGLTVVTLLLDWPLAVVGALLAQVGLVLLGRQELAAMGVNGVLLIGSVFAPLFGVVLVDHFILRKRSARVAPTLLRWTTLLAWLGGVVTYHLLANFMPDVGATLPALLLAGLLQWVAGRSKAVA